ncbi:ABC transporter substrate-binding protein [Paenibacillus sp. MBLB4367]|uniref:ABC transporter substrate-binding protein n=1 Tax=Paenibacillus sp. MBLB4367 TaxID=3384767 RepID=UPI0039084476
MLQAARKSMLRAIPLLSASVLLLSACSKSDDAKTDKKNVTISMMFQQTQFGDAHEQFIKEFEAAHPQIKVKMEVIPDAGYPGTLQTRISTGDLPDIYQLNVGIDSAKLASKAGYIYDLGQLQASKNYTKSMTGASTLDGKFASFSNGVAVLGLLYNKDLFREAGYTKPPATWNELIDAGQKIKAKGKSLLVYASKWETAAAYLFHWVFGDYAFKHDDFKQKYLARTVDFNNPEYKKMLEEGFVKFKELNSFVRQGSFTNEYAIAQQSFANGESAMLVGGTWDAASIRQLNPKFELGFMNIPYSSSEQNSSYIVIPEDGLALNAKSKHLEEAKTFMEWMYSKEVYAKLNKILGNMSGMEGVGALDPAYADVPKWVEQTDRMMPFANTGPVSSTAFVELGNAAQKFTFDNDLNAATDIFIKEYNKTKN